MTYKKCKDCNSVKLLSEFPGNGKNYINQCKNCKKIKYRSEHKTRICRKCLIELSLENFIKRNYYCNNCKNTIEIENKEKILKSKKKWIKNNPTIVAKQKRKHYEKYYYSNDIDLVLQRLLKTCENKKISKKLGFDLDFEYIKNMYENNNRRCAVTNIEFDLSVDKRFFRRPFAPTIDRINSKIGYIKKNVRLVCNAANFALNEFGDEIFDQVCRSYVNNRKEHVY